MRKKFERIFTMGFIGLGITVIEIFCFFSIRNSNTLVGLCTLFFFSVLNGFIFVTALDNQGRILDLTAKLDLRNYEIKLLNKRIDTLKSYIGLKDEHYSALVKTIETEAMTKVSPIIKDS